MKFLCSILAVVATLSCVSAQTLPMREMASQTGPSFYGYAPNKIVVMFDREAVKRFKPEALKLGRTGISEIDQLGEQFRANMIQRQFPVFTPRTFNGRPIELSLYYQVYFADEIDVEQVIKSFNALSSVVNAEPVGIHYVTAMPNDAQFSQQWHLNQANDVDVDAPEAWDLETGDASIIVAVMDTGVRYYHKDLGGSAAAYNNFTNVSGNMWINLAEKNGVAGVDDDYNGYIDDWIGYDFVNGAPTTGIYRPAAGEDGNTPDNDPRDFNGHGTHCAGNIGALNNNGYGLCAVSGGWGNGTFQPSGNGVKVMALRNGYETRIGQGIVQMDAAAQCFVYAAQNGARIASCSWGSSNSGGLGAAIDQFIAAGGLVFHAAGNDNNEVASYMDQRGDCISVAATDQNDNAASFTTYGTWVDISAPGTDIVSLVQEPSDDPNDYLASMSGTSMSTPITASVAALIWSRHPSWTAAQVKDQLFSTAVNIESILDVTHKGKMGIGRVNAYNAVNDAPIAVNLSSFQAVRQCDGRVLVSWQTQAESNSAGFFVQKSRSLDQPFQRAHATLIFAEGSSSAGASYSFIDELVENGVCYYRLEELELDGQSTLFAPVAAALASGVENKQTAPLAFSLHPNYPNPFNPATTISYEIAANDHVRLEIFDSGGRMVRSLVDAPQQAGRYSYAWDGADFSGQRVSSGVYFAKLTSDSFSQTQKMILAK